MVNRCDNCHEFPGCCICFDAALSPEWEEELIDAGEQLAEEEFEAAGLAAELCRAAVEGAVRA